MNDYKLIAAVCGDETLDEFYPTPPGLVELMVNSVKWDLVSSILEPSAGKGDILREIALKECTRYGKNFDVDCIEINPALRQILKYNFGDRLSDIRKKSRMIRDKYKYCEKRYGDGWIYYDEKKYVPVPECDAEIITECDREEERFFENGINIVHDDFLTYTPYTEYDLIIMNPPFSNGDRHLLKALEIQKRGGSVVCLLNAETIRNPFTPTRKELVRKLEELDANIQYLSGAFSSAERSTDVEVALISVNIPVAEEESEIFSRYKEAEEAEEFKAEATDIVLNDYIKAAVSHYNVEVKSGLELIRLYRQLVPYMQTSFDDDPYSKKPILRLTDSNDRGYDSVSVNRYLKRVRLKYWRALLSNPKFVGKLTSKLQTEYQESIEKLSRYDFCEFNIKQLAVDMNMKIKKGVEDEILVMFDRLTDHSYYPECQKNRWLFNGWKTNSAHKIGKKVILPCYGVFSSWSGSPSEYEARKVLEDIERILNYFDGGMSRDVDMWTELQDYFKVGETHNIKLKFFTATFYKKGTVHLVFNCPELIERFNIYAAQNKSWLPPNYGKVKYSDMSAEEKAVVDSFQGEEAYNNVIANAGYYLAAPIGNSVLMIGGGSDDL